MKRRPMKTCQYGVLNVTCGAPADTVRQRPGGGPAWAAGGPTWDVCERHATILDRVRASVRANRPLLDRLAREEHAS